MAEISCNGIDKWTWITFDDGDLKFFDENEILEMRVDISKDNALLQFHYKNVIHEFEMCDGYMNKCWVLYVESYGKNSCVQLMDCE